MMWSRPRLQSLGHPEDRAATSELAPCDEVGAELDPSPLVHGEHLHRGPADGGEAPDQGPLKLEVVVPRLGSRIEERLDVARGRVEPREVRTLVSVASLAREAKIDRVVAAPVFLGDDVLEVEGDERLSRLREAAIFAPVESPLPDTAPGGGIHQALGWRATTERALACKMLMTSMAST